jgi:hypothetical protein
MWQVIAGAIATAVGGTVKNIQKDRNKKMRREYKDKTMIHPCTKCQKFTTHKFAHIEEGSAWKLWTGKKIFSCEICGSSIYVETLEE